MNRKTVLMLFFCLMLTACGHNRQEMRDALATDTVGLDVSKADTSFSEFSDADTLVMDRELADMALPKSVDELFDEFVFMFDQSNRLQRQRTQFPLSIEEVDGDVHFLQRREWKHQSLFPDKESCTVLWNAVSQMDLTEDVTIQEATVEQINLHERIVKAYDFTCDTISRQWHLVGLRKHTFDQSPLQDFLDFYRLWVADSSYQRQHVQEPLLFILTDENAENGTIKGTIDVDQWFEFAPEMPQDVITNIRYGQDYDNRNCMILQIRGINNGLQNLLTFRRDGRGSWRLTTYEN